MTTQKLHDLATSIAGAVLEGDPGEREALIDASCGDDEELRREVESLLAFEDDGFSGEAFVPILSEDRPKRRSVGPYRILRRLGRGGMGAVYLAEQQEPVRRQVAVKLIQAGMDVEGLLQRFEIERNILANLHHPYVAALFDAGTTEDGWPYFAMEYVDGEPIDDYCDEHQLTLRRRLELFRKVCLAVELAHRNLVVHRDLKAGNILVDAEGTPKLLDFGIAKLLHSESGISAVSATSAGFRPMTLACASPEMTRGEPITPASDIYSLGVLLYKLLCGRPPYSVEDRPFLDLLRTIREVEPEPPSVAALRRPGPQPGCAPADEPTPEAIALLRGTVPKKLQRKLAGDLDAIVAKALRKKPRDRYGSVDELSADLRRHLEDQPIRAREPTLPYRAGKLLRRKKWSLMAAASLVLLVLSLALTTAPRLRQQSEHDRARRAQELFAVVLETGDRDLSVEEVLQEGVDLYGDTFRGEHEVQADLLDSVAAVYSSRGHYQAARPLLVEALRLRTELMGDDDLWVAETRIELARLLGRLGEPDEAERLGRLGVDVLRRRLDGADGELAAALRVHAGALLTLGRFQEAEALYREALQKRIALLGDDHLDVAESLEDLAACLAKAGRRLEAEAASHRARSIRRHQ